MTDLATLYDGKVIPFLRPGPRPDRTRSDGWQLWRATLDGFTAAPRLSEREHARLGARHQTLYDLHRTATHANLRLLETPMSARVSELMQRRLQNNAVKWNPGTMDGLMVSGGGKQGKTETVCRALAVFEELWRSLCGEMYAKPPPGTRDEFVPVAYCRLPVRSRPKALCQSILDVFGDPHPKTLHDLVRATRDSLRGHRTSALVIDDVTRLRLHREDDQDTLDLIREVMDLDVTLVLVGVDIPHSGLLRDAYYDSRTGQWIFPETKHGKSFNPQASTQTERRFDVVELDPFEYSTPSGIAAFLEHLAGIEDQLRLLRQIDGMLTSGEMPEYLFRRTRGVVGLLNRLIEDACSVAISTGVEQLTPDLMARVSIRLSDLDDLDPESGEVPDIPADSVPPKPRRRVRNTVFDDHGHRDAAGV
ncbi:MAG TPA: AAA family ATPase [Actinocrinis sp.]|uniref:AAA family ATPase n=1 Tax=Actinocrinis sp. TaxID=1920516 RepID=UPI002DDD771F|nr:AAA family ATPase [Actinocrinis sp.]HEV2345150.1 AAA family ATPase [Actinocrinis sp.]